MTVHASLGEWSWTAEDRTLAHQIGPRLPKRVFDAHAHLYVPVQVTPALEIMRSGPAIAGVDAWRLAIRQQVGAGRLTGGLCVPFPSKHGNVEAANRFVLDEIRSRRGLRALLLATPAAMRTEMEAMLDANPRAIGFKPYHLYAAKDSTFQCRPQEYIPHWVWELADARRLIILLHLVRDHALADPANLAYIQAQCARYPRAQLVLAHAARGFHAPNTVQAIAALRGLDNIWFDTAAVCESDAIAAIFDEFGPRRVLWGSDFPVSQLRGRCVTLGNGFGWITTDQFSWADSSFFGRPVLVGLESMRALLDAADRLGLDDADLQDIFHDNALRLASMMPDTGNATQALYTRAKTLIPGGTQLLSKRPEMFAPEQFPAYFREARGCEVWDLDGRHYIDCSQHGIGATLLGFRDPDVTRAVQRRVALGSLCTLNPPDEVEVAERLIALHPWAEQARFTRGGGEAMAVAVRIARATTDRSAVAICGYHGWHDWYLAANLGESDALRGHLLPGLDPLGVPRELRGTAFPFAYNDREAFDRIIAEYGNRLAAVVMEPCRYLDPEPGFLDYIRQQAHRAGALLIFDEITIGFRLCNGGAHLRLGTQPDIAVFGKTLSNGHLLSAIIGTRAAMEGAHGSFISSSYWTEGVGPAAALATLIKMSRIDVPAHCRHIGERVKTAWRQSGMAHELPIMVDEAYPTIAHFAFDHPLAAELKTLYVQEMLDHGFLANTAIYVSLAHTDAIIDRYSTAIDAVFATLAAALRDETVVQRLRGPVAHSSFKRLL